MSVKLPVVDTPESMVIKVQDEKRNFKLHDNDDIKKPQDQ